MAQDLALFVFFFDLMLVPSSSWRRRVGRSGPVPAALKMVIYTLVGSLLMLAGAVATAVLTAAARAADQLRALRPGRPTRCRSHAEVDLRHLRAGLPDQDAGVPVPGLDAGRVPGDAAAGAGVLLRRRVSKVAAYGFLRLVLPLFPAAVEDFHEVLLILAVIWILYGSVQAFTQTNAR